MKASNILLIGAILVEIAIGFMFRGQGKSLDEHLTAVEHKIDLLNQSK